MAQGPDQTGVPCVSVDVPKTIEFRDALLAALDQQPQLIVAREEVDKSKANLTAALTPFLPNLSATFVDEKFVPRNGSTPVTVVGNEIIGGTQTYSGYASLGLTWNLFNGGKDVAGYRGAKAGKRSSRAELESALSDTLAGVFQAYGDLFDAQRTVLEGRRTSTLLRDIQTRAEERFRSGNGTTLAIEQASNKASQSERSVYQACHSVAAKSAALAKAAGLSLPAGFLLGVGAPLPQIDAASESVISDGLDTWLERDPAVIAARENVTVAEAKLRQAQAAYGPTISLVGRRDYLGQDPENLGGANHEISANSYRIGIQVQQPLLPFTSESSAISSARADVKEARAKYSQAQIDAQGRAQEAWSTQQETASIARAAHAALQSSVRLLTLTESVYKAGRTDLDNLQNARIDVEKSQGLEERAASDLHVANWIFYRALHPDSFPAEVAKRLNLTLDVTGGLVK